MSKANIPYKYLWAAGIPVLGLLAFGLSSSVWYDDACHYLVVHTLANTGLEAFPLEPAAQRWDPHSLFITVGPAANYPTAALMQVLGSGMGTARLSAGLFAATTLFFLWHTGHRQFRHHSTGLWAALLLGSNVQFLTYGSQYLGEPFVLGWLGLGIWAAAHWMQHPRLLTGILAWTGFTGAILSKEYIALPLGLSLLCVLVLFVLHKDKRWKSWGILCLLLPLGSLLYYGLRFHNLADLMTYWNLKRNYSEEFWVFQWRTALAFIACKPLIWLGTLALIVRVYIRHRVWDTWLLALQGFLLLGYVASAAFDRFGLLLLPIPALYLAEWLAAIWARWVSNPYARKPRMAGTLLVCTCLLLFMQRTPLQLYHHLSATEDTLACLKEKVAPGSAFFTYDLQVVPHLMDRHWRLPVFPPSSWQQEAPLALRIGEQLVAGPYAFTEYYLPPPQQAGGLSCGEYTVIPSVSCIPATASTP
ncbi:MAG: glycosyltransferase family 39 protein [Bacteroidetes bacterium]|nr:glycosyltransferase family 39 protein [Bacteroidota bacterium]